MKHSENNSGGSTGRPTIAPRALETQTEEIPVPDVDQHRMGENIPTDETLNVLTLQRCFKHGRFKDHVIWEDEADKVVIAGHVGGRRRVDVRHADRI